MQFFHRTHSPIKLQARVEEKSAMRETSRTVSSSRRSDLVNNFATAANDYTGGAGSRRKCINDCYIDDTALNEIPFEGERTHEELG